MCVVDYFFGFVNDDDDDHYHLFQRKFNIKKLFCFQRNIKKIHKNHCDAYDKKKKKR